MTTIDPRTNERTYLNLLHTVMSSGERRTNRTGTDTIGIFGPQLRFTLGPTTFPLMTTKRVHWKSIAHELLWMLSGSSRIDYLHKHGVTIWDEWASKDYRPELGYEDGDLGPVYGVQWRRWPLFDDAPPFDDQAYRDDITRLLNVSPERGIDILVALSKRLHSVGQWRETDERDFDHVVERLRRLEVCRLEGVRSLNTSDYVEAATDFATYLAATVHKYAPASHVDQIAQIIDRLRHRRDDRRILLSAWNVGEIDRMKLPPCHYSAQFYVDNDFGLHTICNVRSWDLFLGGPFNIAQYALLTHMLAQICHLRPVELIINAGDAHIYVNHLDQVREQLIREPMMPPRLALNSNILEIDDFRYEDIALVDYVSHPSIKGDVAV